MKKLDGLRDVFKNTKHKKITTIYCPKCTSTRIHLAHSLDYWLTPKQYLCDECGYHGPIVLELEKEETKEE
jgi:predicted RNA-binding Zn-ribbon protein involved in translation (DUF1610 family)